MRNAKAGNNNRGSIILMVIGLLTILAMLGTTLLLIARMDQRTSRAVASAAPALEAANSVLDQLRADRAADLHFNGNIAYGTLTKPEDAIDYPYEDANPAFDTDAALANIEPIDPAAAIKKWRHLSHLRIIANTDYLGGANFIGIDALPSDNNLVDTDGDGTNDARLFNTNIQDRDGKTFLAAVRMIDASGLVNINTADKTGAATAGLLMGVKDISLDYLLMNYPGTFNNVTTERTTGGFFDFSDLMALICHPNILPTSGRAYINLGGAYAATRNHLTTLSQSTLACPAYGGFPAPNGKKVDLNKAITPQYKIELYDAFYAMLNAANWSGPVNAFADQLTANVLSFRESSDTPQRGPLGAIGIERQPFITKIFCRLQRSAGTPEDDSLITQVSAIEFFNPYDEILKLDDYYLLDGLNNPVGAAGDWTGKEIPAQGHFVLQSVNTMRLATLPPPGFQGQQQLNLPVLDVFRGNLPLRLMRRLAAGGDICIDSVPGGFAPVFPPVVSQATSTTTWRRDEDPAHARYTVAVYENHLNDDTYNYYEPDALATGDMGVRDPRAAVGISAASCPIYVRNGPFINVGELMRLLMVGPTANVSVPDRLAALPPAELASWSSARLDPNGSILNGAAVHVPPACLIGEYFTVNNPTGAATSLDGLVNINTAPRKVIECLPAIAQLAVADDRTRVVNEIMGYRDYMTYGSGATGSSDYAGISRANVTGITATPIDIRSNRDLDLGFATSGEIAIPIRQVFNTVVTYGPAPGNYAVSTVGDDGFNIGGGPSDDLDKYNVHYKWLSNQVTVRSDTYIAYILVRPGGATGSTQDRRFVALIDRSKCIAAGQLPKVLMMAEVK